MDVNEIQVNLVKLNATKNTAKETMKGQGFTDEQIEWFLSDILNVDMRYYILDDSGSMEMSDGEIYNEATGKMIKDSRYNEMKSSVTPNFNICASAKIRSLFSTLNTGSVEINPDSTKTQKDYQNEFSQITRTTNGATPLLADLESLKEHMKQTPGKKFLVIYSDGVSSDGDITNVLIEIQKMNVNIVIRLCTDEQSVVDYWEQLDAIPELKLDIIDSYEDEKISIAKKNPSLNYTYHFHRLREFGLTMGEIEKLDEISLTEGQISRLNDLFPPKVEAAKVTRCECIIC